MNESLVTVKEAMINLRIETIQDVVQKCLDQETPPIEIVNELSAGLKVVGDRFEAGDYYLSELVLSGEIMKEAMQLLEDKINFDEVASKGTVILATAKGDIHDIGKDIVGMLLSASGFKVIDMGVNIHEDKIIEKVKETGAQAIALSVLLTTIIGSIKDLVDGLTHAGLRKQVKIAIGGACCSQDLADRMGVDAFGEDAVSAVRIFEEFLQ